MANGTYTLYVEKIHGKWLVKQLDLKLISFVDRFNADWVRLRCQKRARESPPEAGDD